MNDIHKKVWLTEPDEQGFEAYSYPCLILRHPHFKHLCGYVGIPESHPLYGVKRDQPTPVLAARFRERLSEPLGENAPIMEIMFSAPEPTPSLSFNNIHCGLTYSADRTPMAADKSDYWWYGFDCAHCDDFAPIDYDMYVGTKMLEDMIRFRTYRDIPYVTNIINNLAFQLREIEDWYNNCQILGIGEEDNE